MFMDQIRALLFKKIPLASGIVFSAYSHAGQSDGLMEMSLKELMDVEIYTASQELESTASSPATTSVITSRQLQQWGVSNLYEALSFLPGVVLNETYMGYSVLTFRGVTPGLYNNKALFMLNGKPVFEPLFGSSHLEYVPLDMVDRIEVVRSPASALYGTNAISGVVNVITKQSPEQNQFTVSIGADDHRYGSLTFHNEYLSLSVSGLNTDGYRYHGTFDELGNEVDIDYGQELKNIFFDYHRNGWRINASYFDMDKEKFGLNPVLLQQGENHFESTHVAVSKVVSFDESEFSVLVSYDDMERALDAAAFPPVGNAVVNKNKVERHSAELQYRTSLTDNIKWIVGAGFEKAKSNPMIFVDLTNGSVNPFSPFLDSKSAENLSVYSQLRYSISKKSSAVVGLRAEDNNSSGSSGLIPRLGFTYEFLPDNYFKILYGEAFRLPVFLEKYVSVPGILQGDPNLEREKIETFEVGFNGRINLKNALSATLFHLDVEDEITRRSALLGGTEYYNSVGREMYGVEVEWKSSLSDRLSADMNMSYMDGEEAELDDAPFTAHYTLNVMLNYRVSFNWDVSLSSQTVSSKDYILNNAQTGSVDSYTLLNAVINYQTPVYQVGLTFKNVLDEDYTYPEPVRRNLSEIPGGAGVSAYLSVSYQF